MDLCKVLTGRGWLDYQLVDWELMTRMTRERGSYLTGLSLRYPCQASSGYFVCRSGSPDSSACQGRSSLQSNGQRDAQRWQTLWGEDGKYVEMSVGLPRDGDWWTTMSMFSVCVKMSEFSLFPIQLKKVKLNFTMLWCFSVLIFIQNTWNLDMFFPRRPGVRLQQKGWLGLCIQM